MNQRRWIGASRQRLPDPHSVGLSVAIGAILLAGSVAAGFAVDGPEQSRSSTGTVELPLDLVLPGASGVAVRTVAEGVSITGLPQRWSYAAVVKLPEAIRNGPAVLDIRLRVLSGKVSVGILNATNDAFISQIDLPVGNAERRLSVDIPDVSARGSLVIRNVGEDGVAPRIVVSHLTVEPTRDVTLRGEASPLETPIPNLLDRDLKEADLARYWFKRYLESEIPILGATTASDFEKVNALRQWAYEHIPVAYDQRLFEGRYGYEIYRRSPGEIMYLADQAMGFKCGGTADTLADLYKMFGFEASTWNMGGSRGLSHVITLVSIIHNYDRIISIQDAYFNYSVMLKSEPLDFLDLLAHLERDDLSDVQMRRGKTGCKPVAFSDEESAIAMSPPYQFQKGPLPGGGFVACEDLSLETFEDIAVVYEEWLQQRIGHRNWLYLYLFPLGVSDGWAQSLVVAAEAARSRLLPEDACFRPVLQSSRFAGMISSPMVPAVN